MNEHDLEVLDEIQRRVLWLATRIVDAANHDRDTGDGVKVGGHQASSASLVTAMTALWFAHLDAAGPGRVKPHASPVFHAIQYLLGNLDRSYLTTLRARGGLQSYPSRTKDPDEVDFSTGSVGLGAAAPLFAAAARRYVDAHFGARPRQPVHRADRRRRARRGQHLGGDRRPGDQRPRQRDVDRRLQPPVARPGRARRPDRPVARAVRGGRLARRRGQVRRAGCRRRSPGPAASALRGWIDAMPNEQYQSLFGLAGDDAAQAVPRRRAATTSATFVADVPDDELAPLVTDLGGHDLGAHARGVRRSATRSPTGRAWSSPTPSRAGGCRSPATRATTRRCSPPSRSTRCATSVGPDRRRPSGTGSTRPPPAGHLVQPRGARQLRPTAPRARRCRVAVPATTGVRAAQADLHAGGVRPGARRPGPRRGGRAVPRHDRAGRGDLDEPRRLHQPDRRVRARPSARSWSDDPVLRWTEGPTGQHIELGISEMNLFLLLGQLGLSWDLSGQPLLPVGTVYDPFVLPRAGRVHLRRLLGLAVRRRRHAVRRHAGARGRRAPVDDHRRRSGSSCPASRFVEPAYATALDWLLCDALGRIAAGPRRPRPPHRPRTARTTSGSPPGRSTRRRSRPRGPGSATRCCAGRCSPAATGWSTRPRRAPRRGAPGGAPGRRPARCCPRCSPPPPSWPTRASPRTSSTSPRWTGSTRPGSAPCGRASGPRPRRRVARRAARGASRTARRS